MAHPDWKIHGDETLAAYLPEKEFRGLLEKRITIPPDLAAILIRDGQLVDSYHGANFSVGGVWQRLKELFGGKHSIRLLVADLKPFALAAALGGFTKDSVEIQAEIAMEYQLDPEKPVNIMGLVSNGRSLTKTEVFERIRPHLKERVIFNELVQHDAEHLRANPGLQDRIQAEIMKEVERIAGDIGLMARIVSVNWGMTADEVQAIKMRDEAREDAYKDFEYARARRDLEREAETTIFTLGTELDVEKFKAASETELTQLLIQNELEIQDARDTGERIRERKALQHEIDIAKEKRLAVYDEQLGDAQTDVDRTRLELDRKRLVDEYEEDRRGRIRELEKLEKLQDIELGRAADEAQVDKIARLQQVQIDGDRAAHDLSKDEFQTKHGAKMEEKQLDSASEIEKMKIQATMDPDQLLAIQAGLSPDVAKVFAERAKASGDREGLLREMLELSKTSKADSEAQAQAMFNKAIENIAEVGKAAAAAGGGGGGGGGSASKPAEETGETVECSACHFDVPSTDRFCRNCGHQLRS